MNLEILEHAFRKHVDLRELRLVCKHFYRVFTSGIKELAFSSAVPNLKAAWRLINVLDRLDELVIFGTPAWLNQLWMSSVKPAKLFVLSNSPKQLVPNMFVWLTHFAGSRCIITGLNLQQFGNILSFEIQDCFMEECNLVSSTLTRLVFDSCIVPGLKSMEGLVALKELSLDQSIVAWEPEQAIKQLPNLNAFCLPILCRGGNDVLLTEAPPRLTLINSPIEWYSIDAVLPQMSSLMVLRTCLETLSFLNTVTSLVELTCYDSMMSNFELLGQLKNLRALGMHAARHDYNGVDDAETPIPLGFLKDLHFLEVLDISDCYVTNFGPLTHLKSLRELYVQMPYIDLDLAEQSSFLTALPKLQVLDVACHEMPEFHTKFEELALPEGVLILSDYGICRYCKRARCSRPLRVWRKPSINAGWSGSNPSPTMCTVCSRKVTDISVPVRYCIPSEWAAAAARF